ncbi:MAG: hypothetical protein HY399_08180 [Elusimicrobia bacterium]|nr:hypothetical protein [Elusimicrobiota bacterium]
MAPHKAVGHVAEQDVVLVACTGFPAHRRRSTYSQGIGKAILTNNITSVILYVMDRIWQITLTDKIPLSVVLLNNHGKVLRRSDHILTSNAFCRLARKSRRQLYRDMRAGRVRPLGKFLGEWLLESSELERLKPIPTDLASLFPEYDLHSMDLWNSKNIILSRVLRFGGKDRIRWAFSFYGVEEIKQFIRKAGERTLDRRSLQLWSLCFNLPPIAISPMRTKGREWGGFS